MSLQSFIEELESRGMLIRFTKQVSTVYEIAALLKKTEGKGVLFENVKGFDTKVVGNLFSSRELIALNLGCNKDELMFKLLEAIAHPIEPKIVSEGECQEVVEKEVDLGKIPVLTHYELDGGPYITSSVIVAKDKEYGRNISTHRIMLYGKRDEVVARICHRDLYEYLKRAGGEIEVAITIGNESAISLASATRVSIDVDEYSIANALKPFTLVKCKTVDLEVPSDCELVLEGVITSRKHSEGPFVDITNTYDMVKREEPVIEIKAITHRENYLYQALLPGSVEHRLLMGMPREPTIYREVNKVCECKNVALTPGGCGWLNGVVQIRKRSMDDGKKAIEAAFKGHTSMKHVVVVDEDIDIFNPHEIEWAIATRFQAKKDAVIFQAPGSSIDSSSDEIPGTDRRETSKVGIDATIPWDKDRKAFKKPKIPINVKL